MLWGGSAGYDCTEEWVTLTDESVTTTQGEFGNAGALAYSTLIDADTIKVTFNGTEYTCDKALSDGVVLYGGAGEQELDFSEYPFAITSAPGMGNPIYTETAGTYQVKIEAVVPTDVSITSCFAKAVAEAIEPLVLNDNGSILDKTFAEIRDAYLGGRTVLLDSNEHYYSITGMTVSSGGGGTITIGADVAHYSANADDAYPTATL